MNYIVIFRKSKVGRGTQLLTGVVLPLPFLSRMMQQSEPIKVTSHIGVFKGFRNLMARMKTTILKYIQT